MRDDHQQHASGLLGRGMRLPALDMTAYSVPIIFSETRLLLAKFVSLGLGQVNFVAFHEHVQQEHQHIRTGVERDHAVTSAFAFAGEPDFPGRHRFLACPPPPLEKRRLGPRILPRSA